VRRARDDRGSALAFVVVFMIVFLGVMALVIDWGSWFTEQRHLQAAADAATMAAAQDLPDTGRASSTATTYADTNISGLDAWTPSFPNTYTIDVALAKKSKGIFSTYLGINSMNVHAHARAQVGTPSELYNVVPIAINQATACATAATTCFNSSKTLTFDDTTTTSFSSSSWGLMDLTGASDARTSCTGSVGASTQSSWITDTFSGRLSVNKWYGATNGQETSIRNAINDVIGKTLLIPVYDVADTTACQSPAKGGFHVVGWAAFVIDMAIPNPDWNPHQKTIRGHFTQYIAHNVESTPGISGFGVKVISLIQ
jgi:Flp pilus assembly protein TadG